MYIVYVLSFVLVILMASRRRKYRRYIRGAIDHKLQLGTLQAQTVISSNVAGTVIDTTFVSSVAANWTLDEFSPGQNKGPVQVGLAHSDYSAAEIEEWIENISGSWDPGDLPAQEIARRKIKIVGTFGALSTGGTASQNKYVLNEGRLVRTKLKWMLNEGDTVKVWAYNTGSGALATTDPQVRVQGAAHLWPR